MSMETDFHSDLCQRVLENCILQKLAAIREYTLPHGRIADVIAFDRNQEIHIFEVKTSLKESLNLATLAKYRPYCHYLWVAFPSTEINHTWFQSAAYDWQTVNHGTGFIAIHRTTCQTLHLAPKRPLGPSVARMFIPRLKEAAMLQYVTPAQPAAAPAEK